MNTKDIHHIGSISFNVRFPNVYTHTHFPTIVLLTFSESTFAGIPWIQYQHHELLVMWYELSGILTSIFLIKLFKADVIT